MRATFVARNFYCLQLLLLATFVARNGRGREVASRVAGVGPCELTLRHQSRAVKPTMPESETVVSPFGEGPAEQLASIAAAMEESHFSNLRCCTLGGHKVNDGKVRKKTF